MTLAKRKRKKADDLQVLQSANSEERQPALKNQAAVCDNHRATMRGNSMSKAMAIKRKILHEAQEEAGTQQVEACKRRKDWKRGQQPDVDRNSASNSKLLAGLFIECLQQDGGTDEVKSTLGSTEDDD